MAKLLGIFLLFISLLAAGALLSIIIRWAPRAETGKDKSFRNIWKLLPGYDCAVCGFPECTLFAKALMEGRVFLEECTALGPNMAKMIRTASEKGDSLITPEERAVVLCAGTDDKAKKAFGYEGLRMCKALYQIAEGDRICKSACLGLGDCIKVCPEKAILLEEGVARVVPELCSGCGKCISSCPKGILRMIPSDADYYVACSSHESADFKANACTAACTACRDCEKKCAGGGFFIRSSLAELEYSFHGERSEAFVSCPAGVIRKYMKGEKQ